MQHDQELDPLEAEEKDDAIIGVAFRWSLLVILVIMVVIAAVWYLRRETPTEPNVIERAGIDPPAALNQEATDRPEVQFTDITEASGISFTHQNGATGEKLLPETMGSGVAFLDYDNDGDPDLLLVNSNHWPWSEPGAETPVQALYENDGTGQFKDVTQSAGLQHSLYGTGVACGDIDNDGDVDLFLAALGANKLLRNDDAVFTDVTAEAGVAGDSETWSTSAGFFDYDRDGLLDLFVCSYVVWSRDIDLKLDFSINGRDRAYGPPTNFKGTFCYLYRNLGNGSFEDVSASSGIQVTNPATNEPMGKALAVTFSDLDRDGWMDVIVANDTVQNFVFHNRKGTFVEYGSESGMAFDSMGNATGAMGIDAADFGNQDRIGIGVANFSNESTSFYVQQPGNNWIFNDMTNSEGIGSPSRLRLSFGLFFFDYDLDGRLDLFQSNGHLEETINEVQPSQHFRQPAQLFWNRGEGAASRFVMVPMEETGDLANPIVGRSSAYADIDGDGDLDIAMTQAGGSARLLRNDSTLDHHWLRLRLIGKGDAIGARVTLTCEGVTQTRVVNPTRSYLAQVEHTLTFGLGTCEAVSRLEVTWLDGTVSSVDPSKLDRTLTVRQPGTGL